MPAQLPIEVARALIGVDYPLSREQLIQHVVHRGGQPQVLALLKQLPDRGFADEQDLANELGGTA